MLKLLALKVENIGRVIVEGVRGKTIISSVAISAMLMILGCESVEEKQISVCAQEIKVGLNDPNSMEIISSEKFKLDDGTYRIGLDYTAKNKFGGRVRDKEFCGFKTVDGLELNPDDFLNQKRNLKRSLSKIGVNIE